MIMSIPGLITSSSKQKVIRNWYEDVETLFSMVLNFEFYSIQLNNDWDSRISLFSFHCRLPMGMKLQDFFSLGTNF